MNDPIDAPEGVNPAECLIASKREAVRLIRQAQSALEKADWHKAPALLNEARELALDCLANVTAIADMTGRKREQT